MGIADDMKRVAEELVSSYQARISEVAIIIDDTNQILEDFKTKRSQMNDKLKESLARGESLRRKDFDAMMTDILTTQDKRAKEVKSLLRTFFEEQREIAEFIRKNLAGGEKIRIEDFRKMLKGIQAKQKARENDVRTTLMEFQAEYTKMAGSLRSLLNKGEAVRIKDFKEMVKNIRSGQIERQEEVRKRLDEFREERLDTASEWHKITSVMAEKRKEVTKEGGVREKEKASKI